MICSLDKSIDFNTGKESYLISSSAFIKTSKILLFAPLTISVTSPLTGEQKLILSLYLSKKTTEPALTLSPIFTDNLGVKL